MTLHRLASLCALFAHGCFSPGSGSTSVTGTDTDAATDFTASDTQNTGSAVTSVSNSASEPSTSNTTQTSDPSDTNTTTSPPTTGETETSETQTGSTGVVEPMCGDGVPVASELCYDDSPLSYDVDPGAVDVAIGDFDDNGQLDIVVLHNDPDMGLIAILEADGVGGFVEGNTEQAAPYAGRVRVADPDGDGDDDIFAIGSGALQYFRNEVAFFNTIEAASFFGGDDALAEVIIADVNGDGTDDAISNQAYSHGYYPGVLNMGNWSFDPDYVGFPTPGEGASGMIAGAFSFDAGDDDIDIVAMNQYYSSVTVLTNDGSGMMTEISTPFLCPGEFDGVRFGDSGDFNGDGNTDVVVTCDDGDVGVSLDDGSGTFAEFTTLALAGAYRPTAVDLDNDDDLDLLVSSGMLMRAVVFLNDGTGTFDLSDTQFMGTGPVYGAAASDLDDDGAMDIVIASGGLSSHVDVYFAIP